MERAQEELARVNIEVARLHTWMHDEEAEYEQHIMELKVADPLLCGELQECLNQCRRTNGIHRRKLAKLFELTGYTGSTHVGHRVGASGLTIRIPAGVVQTGHNDTTLDDNVQDRDEDGDDEDNEEMFQLGEFIENIPDGDI